MNSNVANDGGELNLAQYVAAVRRRWLWVVACGLLGALIAFGWTSFQARQYRAEASLAVIRSGVVADLDSRVQIVSDTDPAAQSLEDLLRRRSLVEIGNSTEVAQAVVGRLSGQLPPDLLTPQNLAKRISLTADGDLIRIAADAATPELALALAQTWVEEYVKRVNLVLGEGEVNRDSLVAQADAARAEYETRQRALESYLATSQVAALELKSNELVGELDARTQVRTKLSQAQLDAVALRARIAEGGETPANSSALAQLLLEATAFNNSGELPARIDLSAAPVATTRAEQLAQLDGLLAAIQERIRLTDVAGDEALTGALSATRAGLEKARAQQRELEAARDLAWTSYQAVASKVAEVDLTDVSAQEWVRVTSSAALPNEPLESRRLLNTLIGGMVGLIVGVVLALGADRLRGRADVGQPAATQRTTA